MYKRANAPPPLSTAAKSYAQALSESNEFDPFDFPELSPTTNPSQDVIMQSPTQSPTITIRRNAQQPPPLNTVTPPRPAPTVDSNPRPVNMTQTNELEILNQKMDAYVKEWRATTKNIEERQNAFQVQVSTSVKNLHKMITDQQNAFTKMQNQMNAVLETQKTTM